MAEPSKKMATLIEQLVRLSQDRRAAAAMASEEIREAQEALRRKAKEAMKAGLLRHLGACGVPERLLSAMRSNLAETSAMRAARAWVEGEKPVLVLRGGVGAGKSLAAARTLARATRMVRLMAHPLADEETEIVELDARRGLFLTAADLHFARRWEADKRGPSLLDRAATVQWLVLDELRADDFRGAGHERLEEVLGERYARELRTCITTNLGADEMAGLLGDRLASRFAEGAMVVECGDRDLRQGAA